MTYDPRTGEAPAEHVPEVLQLGTRVMAFSDYLVRQSDAAQEAGEPPGTSHELAHLLARYVRTVDRQHGVAESNSRTLHEQAEIIINAASQVGALHTIVSELRDQVLDQAGLTNTQLREVVADAIARHLGEVASSLLSLSLKLNDDDEIPF